jgi:Domain of unknown function (DUF4265)
MVVSVSEHDFIAVHLSPAWAVRANFKIFADVSNDETKQEWEQLWAFRETNSCYVICCIPFFTYGLSLGDCVSIDDRLVVVDRVSESGFSTIRIWFGDTEEAVATKFGADVFASGFLVEWQSKKMLAIAAPDKERSEQLIELIESRCFQYELG